MNTTTLDRPQGLAAGGKVEPELTTTSLQVTEAECGEGRTAPRVALADIEAAIQTIHFVPGDRAALAGEQNGFGNTNFEALRLLTICLVVMKNGFTIIGKSAPASPDNFDVKLGQKLAYEDAVRQIWPLMGFALRDRLHHGEVIGATAG